MSWFSMQGIQWTRSAEFAWSKEKIKRIWFPHVTAKAHASMFILSAYKLGFKVRWEGRRIDWFQSTLFRSFNASSAKRTCPTKSKWTTRKTLSSTYSGLPHLSSSLKGSTRTATARFSQWSLRTGKKSSWEETQTWKSESTTWVSPGIMPR